jgi:hypothetical protein
MITEGSGDVTNKSGRIGAHCLNQFDGLGDAYMPLQAWATRKITEVKVLNRKKRLMMLPMMVSQCFIYVHHNFQVWNLFDLFSVPKK